MQLRMCVPGRLLPCLRGELSASLRRYRERSLLFTDDTNDDSDFE